MRLFLTLYLGLPNAPHALPRTEYQPQPQALGPTVNSTPAHQLGGSAYQPPQASLGPSLNSTPSHHQPNMPTMNSGVPAQPLNSLPGKLIMKVVRTVMTKILAVR